LFERKLKHVTSIEFSSFFSRKKIMYKNILHRRQPNRVHANNDQADRLVERGIDSQTAERAHGFHQLQNKTRQ
jgi:hypothetical protein